MEPTVEGLRLGVNRKDVCAGQPAGARVVLDAGIAKEYHLAGLRDPGYRSIVVSRCRCAFDAARAVHIQGRSGPEVQRCRRIDPATGEIFLACRSEAGSTKEPAIPDRSAERFETVLQKIHDGLSRPRARRRVDDVRRRIGRIREPCRRAARHCAVEGATDDLGAQATAVTGKRRPVPNPERTRPGVHALRSNLRACQWVQMIHRTLQANGDHRSWSSLRADLEVVCPPLRACTENY